MSSDITVKLKSPDNVVIKSSDNVLFEVNKAVAWKWTIVKDAILETGSESVIPLPRVSAKILAMIIDYTAYHLESHNRTPAVPPDEIKNWDINFMDVDTRTLQGLMEAADYLNFENLLNLACQTMANLIMGKTPEEIRRTFTIKNDFTKEEEEKGIKDNEWALRKVLVTMSQPLGNGRVLPRTSRLQRPR